MTGLGTSFSHFWQLDPRASHFLVFANAEAAVSAPRLAGDERVVFRDLCWVYGVLDGGRTLSV